MSDTFQLELVTPEKLVFSQAVSMVEIPGEEGDFGVLAGHSPLVSTIRAGIISIHTDHVQRLFVAGGVAEVSPTSCTILAEQVIDIQGINKADAEARLGAARKAQEAAVTEIDIHAATNEVRLSEALVSALS